MDNRSLDLFLVTSYMFKESKGFHTREKEKLVRGACTRFLWTHESPHGTGCRRKRRPGIWFTRQKYPTCESFRGVFQRWKIHRNRQCTEGTCEPDHMSQSVPKIRVTGRYSRKSSLRLYSYTGHKKPQNWTPEPNIGKEGRVGHGNSIVSSRHREDK